MQPEILSLKEATSMWMEIEGMGMGQMTHGPG